MHKHDWMDSVLRDVIAYAVRNKMPEVARYVAMGHDALHLHVYDEERRVARALYGSEHARGDSAQGSCGIAREGVMAGAAKPCEAAPTIGWGTDRRTADVARITAGSSQPSPP